MILATLLAGAALQAAYAPPPPPPAPPAPPAARAPLPPPPPLPPLPLIADGDQQVMSFNDDGRHVTIIKRRAGERGAAVTARSNNVLTYKDATGHDVTVFSDKPLTQADAERMERDMRAKIPEITAKAMAEAKARTGDVRIITRRALEQADEARHEGDLARLQGEKARDYAQVIVKRMHDKDGAWAFDNTGPSTAMFRHGDFAGPADLKALRDEVHALREEVEALRAQLKGGVTH